MLIWNVHWKVYVLSPDVCSDTTCHNDGACIIKSPDKFTCICKEGFTGVKCEQGV